ncbi:class I SAM-dependent methyltransferase [Salinisphaera aquimarina]|uniref:Class I SAM-dependent methyltransferase n=1 Tax=Salinisphaera aquimarina TaxID=2094031 RepID=A0ABV7EM46_9GAMM
MNMKTRRAIDLAGFEAKFRALGDPWQTFTARDEAIKRERIVRALGNRPVARLLELGSGNGSNSQRLAARALRLDACDGSASATALTRQALAGHRHAYAWQIALPAALPGDRYDAVVIAELLYYLSPRNMHRLARDVAAVLTPSGTLVLAHHQIEFHDSAQRAAGIHARFVAAMDYGIVRGRRWQNRRWQVEAWNAPR